MDVRSRRVSSTHAWRCRRSSGEVGILIGTTRTGVVDLAAAVLGTCRNVALVFVVPRQRTLPPSYAAKC